MPNTYSPAPTWARYRTARGSESVWHVKVMGLPAHLDPENAYFACGRYAATDQLCAWHSTLPPPEGACKRCLRAAGLA